MNEWLQVALNAKAVCSEAGALVNMSDFAIHPALAMKSNEIFQTGRCKYRFIRTPHLPRGWDAGVMFEESDKTLLCSDLFHQNGDLMALTDKDILEAHKSSMLIYGKGPLMDYTPYNYKTKAMLLENQRSRQKNTGFSFPFSVLSPLELIVFFLPLRIVRQWICPVLLCDFVLPG